MVLLKLKFEGGCRHQLRYSSKQTKPSSGPPPRSLPHHGHLWPAGTAHRLPRLRRAAAGCRWRSAGASAGRRRRCCCRRCGRRSFCCCCWGGGPAAKCLPAAALILLCRCRRSRRCRRLLLLLPLHGRCRCVAKRRPPGLCGGRHSRVRSSRAATGCCCCLRLLTKRIPRCCCWGGCLGRLWRREVQQAAGRRRSACCCCCAVGCRSCLGRGGSTEQGQAK